MEIDGEITWATYESKRYAFSGAALSSIDATAIADGTVLDAEFQYINTLSSNAQDQLTARLPLAGGTMTGAAHFNDNVKASFGNTTGTPDMEIYHDGSNSYIKNGTGYLRFLEDNYEFRNNANNATFLTITSSGLTGVGTGLTALTAANLTGTYPALNGASITSLNATNLASGTVNNARLPSAISVTSVAGNGSGLTNLNASNISTGTLSSDRMGGNVITGTGSAGYYSQRAWVQFNSNSSNSIYDSENVSSISDHAVGKYSVNFSTAMPSADYGVTVTPSSQASYFAVDINGWIDSTGSPSGAANATPPTTNAVRIAIFTDYSLVWRDTDRVVVSVFGV
jgi:hypothetical protein